MDKLIELLEKWRYQKYWYKIDAEEARVIVVLMVGDTAVFSTTQITAFRAMERIKEYMEDNGVI